MNSTAQKKTIAVGKISVKVEAVPKGDGFKSLWHCNLCRRHGKSDGSYADADAALAAAAQHGKAHAAIHVKED